MTMIIRYIAAFLRNRRGNVAIMTGLCAVPLVGMVGLSIDYANAVLTKTKLDAAADAAAIAAITKAQAVILANSGATGTAFTDGQAQGAASFKSNAGANAPTPTITISRDTTLNTVSATVTYGTTSANSFGQMFGVASNNLHGSNSSTMNLKQYISIYLLVDISNSMGIAATTQDMNTMYAATGCVFGCHVGAPSNETTGHAHGATLRIDVVKTAISNMISQTQSLAGTPSTAQIGLYTMEMDAKIISPPTTSFATLQTLLNTQVDLGSNISPYTSADTSVQIAINTFTGFLPAQGDGSTAAKAKNFVFVLTDGTSDTYNGAGGNTITTFNPNWFTQLQQKATVGIIYTTYLPFYNNNNPANGYDYWYSVDILPIAPYIANALQSCTTSVSSPTKPYPWFFSATSASDINAALRTLLLQAMANTRLTQ